MIPRACLWNKIKMGWAEVCRSVNRVWNPPAFRTHTRTQTRQSLNVNHFSWCSRDFCRIILGWIMHLHSEKGFCSDSPIIESVPPHLTVQMVFLHVPSICYQQPSPIMYSKREWLRITPRLIGNCVCLFDPCRSFPISVLSPNTWSSLTLNAHIPRKYSLLLLGCSWVSAPVCWRSGRSTGYVCRDMYVQEMW